VPLLVLWGVRGSGGAGGSVTWQTFWTLFGTSNQLLAALTLLGITVWLRRTGRRYWFALAPMLFVMVVTVTALVVQVMVGWRAVEAGGKWTDPAALNAMVGVALLGLAGVFVWEAARSVRVEAWPPDRAARGITGDAP
ncbi:MAG: hypothetical protein H7Y88_00940, partial [Phycisphaerales bacterium]|nr:hypothetical protein [Phycisphaerales bacterium]